jgi:hypothetical protein
MKFLCTAFLLFLTIFLSTISAQPSLGIWQWAHQAGGVYNTANGQNEQVKDMCTDKYGNIYTVGTVYRNPYFNGQQFFAPFASFGSSDAFVAKYDKCGNLKWVRFGGTTTLNVYILGFAGTNNAQFPDSNHTLTIPRPGTFWAKYDSTGNIKWVNVSTRNEEPTPYTKMKFRPNGNICAVLAIDTGIFYPGFYFRASHDGNALFEYDRNGNPANITPLDSTRPYTASAFNIRDVSYQDNGNIVFAYAVIDTTRIFDSIFYTPTNVFRDFLIKANYLTKKIIWVREFKEGALQQSGISSAIFDKIGNIYVSGNGEKNSVFLDDTIQYSHSTGISQPLIYKIDSDGGKIWGYTGDANTNNTSFTFDLMRYNNDQKIIAPMQLYQNFYWAGDTFRTTGAQIGLMELSSNTGAVISWDPLPGTFNVYSGNQVGAFSQDEQGSILLGGYISAGLYAGNSIYNIGGKNDAFLMKWGLNCTDSDALITPLAAERLVANASGTNAIDVDWQNVAQYANSYRVYRSTVDSITGYVQIDSVSKYAQHYTDVNVTPGQPYWYKVSAVNSAGETYSNADSASIHTVGISEMQNNIRHIALYPNPANSYTQLSIWNDASLSLPASISVIDMEGREFYGKQAVIAQGKNDLVMDISSMATGIYVVNIRVDNASYSKRLVIVR